MQMNGVKKTQKLDIALYEEWRNIEAHCYNEQVKIRQN
jgi:CRISPR/Cas system CSM-associated protein Csm4 (group 5 of RAMP superfamily)